MYMVCWGLIPWKKLFYHGFTSVSLLPFIKKLGRSSCDVTMTHYGVTLILFFFSFVANVRDLQWDNFLVLIMNRKGVIRIYLPRAKMNRQAYIGLKNPDLIGLIDYVFFKIIIFFLSSWYVPWIWNLGNTNYKHNNIFTMFISKFI